MTQAKTSAEIRSAFLDFFASKDHQIVSSSSLVPANDPTLLFTNAGMVQFKDCFLGTETRNYVRATSSQRCVRAGGKHNDLENVGYTARHHTFFEMLGNFSFGDYFKRQAIFYAWEFLTKTLELSKEKLWVTVHVSDNEAAKIWTDEVGVDPQRMSRLEEDNFWQMGDTGPCGPCSEIFYDHGETVPGGPPGSPDEDMDRYIEIWNLVFMQYERQEDGALVPLPKPSVDTGMGLERIAAVMQGVHNNYEIDLFAALCDHAADVIGVTNKGQQSLRVVADHIRSCSFLIVDGVLPSNEGRGYVLRRIIRRAIRHGNKLGQQETFFHRMVAGLVSSMGSAYPELKEKQSSIEAALKTEEEQFAKTLEKGLAILENELVGMTGTIIPGELIFKLYDTYGFPVDLTNDIAREKNLTLDTEGYEQLMAEQKQSSKAAGNFKAGQSVRLDPQTSTQFTGYDNYRSTAHVVALFMDGEPVQTIDASNDAVVVLDQSPFYGESGGQVGDSGMLQINDALFEVSDTQKQGASVLHFGRLKQGERVKLGDAVDASIHEENRSATARNHSATHLLHSALRQELGEHVEQKGSLVDAERLRFDFAHGQALDRDELARIEKLVNLQILGNHEVGVEITSMEEAKKKGAVALFGEKYGDEVRVLSMGEPGFSIELCGGTHVKRTGDIGLFRITQETGISAGVRRIEAVTGWRALQRFDDQESRLQQLSAVLKAPTSRLADKAQSLIEKNKQLEKELMSLKAKASAQSAQDWVKDAVTIHGIPVLIKGLENVEGKALRELSDQLKNKLKNGIVILANAAPGKVAMVASVDKSHTSKVKAGEIVAYLASRVGGKGGGRPDMAQGGGSDDKALPAALNSLTTWLDEKLSDLDS